MPCLARQESDEAARKQMNT